jgi:hypothetical protein
LLSEDRESDKGQRGGEVLLIFASPPPLHTLTREDKGTNPKLGPLTHQRKRRRRKKNNKMIYLRHSPSSHLVGVINEAKHV